MIKKILWERQYVSSSVSNMEMILAMGGMDNLLEEEPETKTLLDFIDFWIARTNFSITKSMLDPVVRVRGIEIFEPASRYSFRIGVPREKFFNLRTITKEVEKQAVSGFRHNVDVAKLGHSIDSLSTALEQRDELDDCFDQWHMEIWPHGEFNYKTYDCDDIDAQHIYADLNKHNEGKPSILLTAVDYMAM